MHHRILVRLFLLMLPLAAAHAAAPPVMPLDDLEAGMKGYGLTVFSGTRVDTFGVEIVGVQRGVRVDGSFIIVELSGHDLETSSIARGMSGSPVYIDGRFVGALAFGWEGALRPLAGVTPAEEMLALPRNPAPVVGAAPRPTDPGALAGPLDGALWTGVFGGAAPPAGAIRTPLPAGLPAPDEILDGLMAMAGIDSDAASWLVRPAGAAAVGAGDAGAAPLRPGSACAVPLVTGDALLGAIGTVTWVDGEDVLMMGHPFLQRGAVNLPLAAAEIVTLFPSRAMSFKMGSIGEPVGTVHHDLRSGLAGELGPVPETIPVTVDIDHGDRASSYRFSVVDDRQLTPMLVYWSLYNALLAGGDDASDQTLEFRLTTRWTGDAALADRPLVTSGRVAGPGGAASLAAEWMTPLVMLMNNPRKDVSLQSVQLELDRWPGLRRAAVDGLDAPRRLDPRDGAVDAAVKLRSERGGSRVVTVPVELPAHLPAGRYRLVAGGAGDLFALEAQRAAAAMRPGDLAGLRQLLERPRSASRLVVAVYAPGSGVVVAGREHAGLPGSARGVLRTGRSAEERPLADLVAWFDVETNEVLTGHAVRNIEVPEPTGALGGERRP